MPEKRRRGRPATGRKTASLTLTLPPLLIARVKEYAKGAEVSVSAFTTRALLKELKSIREKDDG